MFVRACCSCAVHCLRHRRGSEVCRYSSEKPLEKCGVLCRKHTEHRGISTIGTHQGTSNRTHQKQARPRSDANWSTIVHGARRSTLLRSHENGCSLVAQAPAPAMTTRSAPPCCSRASTRSGSDATSVPSIMAMVSPMGLLRSVASEAGRPKISAGECHNRRCMECVRGDAAGECTADCVSFILKTTRKCAKEKSIDSTGFDETRTTYWGFVARALKKSTRSDPSSSRMVRTVRSSVTNLRVDQGGK